MLVQLDRLVKEFIVPLEKQINSEHEEKKQVAEKETQEIIVGQKRRSRTCTGKSSTSTSASKEMVAAGGTRRSKRVKVAPNRCVPVVEEESFEASPQASSGVVIRNTSLPASPAASPPLDNISATAETTVMNAGINEDVNTMSTRRVLAVAATTRVTQINKGKMSFDERFKDLTAFKAEYGHCNAPNTRSRNNAHRSLGKWCSAMRQSYKAIKEGQIPGYKLSKANMKRLENAGFEWVLGGKIHTFDERFKDLMAFKAKFGHCNVPQKKTKSRNNKHVSLGNWCNHIRHSYKAIKEGRSPGRKLSKADIRRLENAGFAWGFRGKTYTFDERFKDLTAFKADYGHCNVPRTQSRHNKHLSLGNWCKHIRLSYKAIKEGRRPDYKLSKADIRRLEKTGFKWRRHPAS
jgi:hypothetical protein